jgi:hypothetical protein
MNKVIVALWKKEKDGMEYLSGVINDLRGDINIAIFPNTYKTAENQPDFNITVSLADKQLREPETEPATLPKNGKKKSSDVEEREVPF